MRSPSACNSCLKQLASQSLNLPSSLVVKLTSYACMLVSIYIKGFNHFYYYLQLVLRIPRCPYAQVQLVWEGYPPKDDRHWPHVPPQGRQEEVPQRIQGGHRRRLPQEKRVIWHCKKIRCRVLHHSKNVHVWTKLYILCCGYLIFLFS